ncbi:helix-turn-helix domain-containing protein [Carnobacterium divergens]|uniref:helix-turn-helix domain-containing protein n=1 Tax=Carnobacterium divergens TaxID=2748 RepID=UPI0039AEB4CC
MQKFLEKSDSRKIEVINFLEESYLQQASISTISKNLKISEFILVRTVNELIEDIEKYQLSHYFTLSKTDKVILLKKSGAASINLLLWIYLKQSLSFELLDEIFKGTFENINYYSEKNFVSYTKIYKRLMEIKKILNEHDIRLSSKFKLAGDEMNIRMFFYQFYVPVFNQIEFPFADELKAVSQELITNLEKIEQKSFSEATKTKLSFFIGVMFNRIGTDCYLFNASKIKDKELPREQYHEAIYPTIIDFVKTYTGIEQQNFLIAEANFIFAFLIGETIIKEQSTEKKAIKKILFQTEKREYHLFSNFLMEELSRYLAKDIPDDLKEQFLQQLDFIHFKVFYFERINTEFTKNMNVEYIKENYWDAYHFSIEFLEKISKEKEYRNIALNKEFLFYQYLFIIINTFPPAFFMKPIKICVDFSLGVNYNQMILTNLQTFSYLNIEVSDTLTSETDLLISDYYFNEKLVNCEYLVWNMPPTASDWANVGEALMRIKKSKETEGIVNG